MCSPPWRRAGVAKSWSAQVVVGGDTAPPSRAVAGRVCALRTAAAIKLAHRKIRKEATRKGKQPQPDTLRFAEYVIVFTTFPAAFSAAEILEWYRLRWQVELVFKRFAGPVGTSAEIRRRQRESVAVRQVAGRVAGREADSPCQRDFPLGIRLGVGGDHRARGVSSSSCSTNSPAASNRRCRWRG